MKQGINRYKTAPKLDKFKASIMVNCIRQLPMSRVQHQIIQSHYHL